jgi:ankyrin repeat protein
MGLLKLLLFTLQLQMAIQMIAAEAKLNAATQFGYQAIHIAAREVHTDCVRLHLDASIDVDEPAGIEKYAALHEDLR